MLRPSWPKWPLEMLAPFQCLMCKRYLEKNKQTNKQQTNLTLKRNLRTLNLLLQGTQMAACNIVPFTSILRAQNKFNCASFEVSLFYEIIYID